MSHAFTTDDLVRFEVASRTLLSPLAAPTMDDWRAEVARAVRALFRADHAVFGITDQPRPYVCDGIDETTWGYYAAYITQTRSAWGTRDPVLDRWLHAHQATGGGAFDEPKIDAVLRPHNLALRDSELMNGVAWPNRMYGIRGITVAHTTRQAGLQVTYERRSAARSDGTDLPLLSALMPSFRSGLDALDRLCPPCDALDAITEPLVAFTPDARELHRNTALTRLRGTEPERARIEFELTSLARALRSFTFPLQGEGGELPPAAERTPRTSGGRYVLRGSVLVIGILLRFMDSFMIYTEPFVLTGGGPGNSTTFLSQTLTKMAIGQFDLGPAAAFSLIYFLIVLLVSWLFFTTITHMDKAK
jgi:hypothetical protein